MTVLYNVIMLAVDVASIWLVNRRKTLLVWAIVMGCAGVAILSLGGILAAFLGVRGATNHLWGEQHHYRQILHYWTEENHFGIFRLWAYGVFGHGLILLLGTAVAWRRSRPRFALAAVAASLVLMGVAADAFLIEPHWLDVTHHRIASPKIQRPVRIAVVADLQTMEIGNYERGALKRVVDEKPDLILLAGDYLHARSGELQAQRAKLHDYLRDIKFTAPLGVFAIQGNVDLYPAGWQDAFAGLGITTVNQNQTFQLDQLQVTCLGLMDSFNAGLQIANSQPDTFHIVLGHAPDFALGQIDADLLLAGHTHGGQVQIPGLGAIVTHSRVPNSWASGKTELPHGGILMVSRGIGMERGYAPPMRFCCRPELMIVDLVPAEAPRQDLRATNGESEGDRGYP